MAEHTYAAPIVDPYTRAVWDAAREHRLLIGLCRDTGKHYVYPRGVSPFTLSSNVELVQAKGTGTVYTFTVMRGPNPSVCAYVTLDEGPSMVTDIVDCDLAEVRIGMKVRVVFKPTVDAKGEAGAPLPMFTAA